MNASSSILYESIGFPYSLNTVNTINLFEFYESKK